MQFSREIRCIAALGLGLAAEAGCAHRPAAAPAEAAPAAHVDGAPPASPLESRRVTSADDLRVLCAAMADERRAVFEGNEIAQARAREAHRTRRLEVTEATYEATIPADGFTVAGYDPGAAQLALDARALSLGDGAALSAAGGTRTLVFSVPPDPAERLLDGKETGRVALLVSFRPSPSQMRDEACVRLGGGMVKMSAEVIAARLVDDGGTPIASLETGAGGEEAGDAPVTTPTITAGRVVTAGRQPLPAEIVAGSRRLGGALLGCYRQALAKRPQARGMLVIGATLGTDGRLGRPRMEVSSLGDQALVSCALGRLAGQRLASKGLKAPIHLSIPFDFGG